MATTSPPVAPESTTPALPPPQGVTSDFVNPWSLFDDLVPFMGVLIGITVVMTGLRVYTKLRVMQVHALDDYLMVLASAGFIAYVALGFKTGQYGAGIHNWNVPLSEMPSFHYWANTAEIVYAPVFVITKISIIVQQRRIFVPHHDKTYWAIQIFIWINILYYIAYVFLSIFQCSPRTKIWYPTTPGSCLKYQYYIIVTAVFNAVSDIVIWVFPFTRVWRLRMSGRRKWSVSAAFFIGGLAIAASAIRIAFSASYLYSFDLTYGFMQITACTYGEIAAGIIASNSLVLPALIKQVWPKLSGMMSTRRSDSGSDDGMFVALTAAMSRKGLRSARSWQDG